MLVCQDEPQGSTVTTILLVGCRRVRVKQAALVIQGGIDPCDSKIARSISVWVEYRIATNEDTYLPIIGAFTWQVSPFYGGNAHLDSVRIGFLEKVSDSLLPTTLEGLWYLEVSTASTSKWAAMLMLTQGH